MDYDIVLLFGETELKGLVAWKENVRLFSEISWMRLTFLFSFLALQGVEKRYVGKQGSDALSDILSLGARQR